MLAIYKRELKSYFRSFIGLLFIAVTLFFLGLYFTVYNLLNGYPYFAYSVSSVIFLFMLSVPILTMRILAEEKRSKTDQLILTAPVSVGAVVMGKFLALVTIFLIPTLIACVYPLIMANFGSVPMGEAYLSILAFFLFGTASIAVGVFISSLTESQVIAAVLSFAVLFLGYMMPSICSIISSTGNLLTRLLGCFDMYTPFANLLEGTLNIGSIVYFVSLTALVLFLTVQSIQKRRYSVSVKNLSFSAYSTGMIALAIAVVAAANLVIGEMPSSWTAIDLTSEKLYSLTDQTKEFVNNMQEDVTIYVIVNEDNQDTTLGQTLQRYDDLSDHITVEYVDPTVNPRFHTQYTDSTISINSLIVVSDKRNRVIDYSDIYESSFDYSTYTSTTTGYDGEGQITSALDYVLSDDLPKVYLTEGHGEYSLSSSFTDALTKENVEYETINLMDYDTVPEDTACLIINGPQSDLSADDADKVTSYLESGGKVILITGYTGSEMPNRDALLEYMGMSIADGLVVEQDQNYYYRSPYYLLPDVSADTYTSGIYGNYYIFAPYSQGILIADEEAEGMTYTTFLSTSESAYSKVDITNMENFEKSEGDIDGPFGVGVEAVKALEEGEATMVVYSCDQLFTDDANVMVSGANQMMFVNTVGGFVDHEVSVSIPVKSYQVSYLTVNQSDAVLIGLVTTIVLPVGCLAAGFVIWFRRRKR
ncbi:MAG TPA: Gldg family protein [Candidatus Acetatifactor stercoripullorum]|uniref:Gldg family protein n=1 Tax=Candidatus Acetatifactor stercoripullorum TaxID=2838414 RepID=A0A9D1UBC7_9FIRM|nr:Gldg family protein [uncultured Acetatifactor sp.]HIW81629.1 Gldg family protein [Candidatus Acetatifactor stercoripullorum]